MREFFSCGVTPFMEVTRGNGVGGEIGLPDSGLESFEDLSIKHGGDKDLSEGQCHKSHSPKNS